MIHPAKPPRSTYHALKKRLRWFLATAVVLEIAYVVLGNLFLHFALLPIINRQPMKVFMAFDGAYTLWPGIAHVEHFRLRNQSRAIQWNLEVEEADVTIDLPALFDKKFHAYRTRASGVSFRLRRKLDDDHAATARAAAVAPIEGYEDPPLAPIGPPKAPMTDANYDEWRVAMEDVDAAVNEVWIDEWRWLGGGHVIGGFYMKPERLLQVGPCSIDVHQGQFQVGGRPALTGIDAHIDALIDALDFRVPMEVGVRSISARGRFGGSVPNLDFIQLYLPSDSPFHVEEGGGNLHTYFHVANGRILPATRLDVNSDHLILAAGQFGAAVAFEAAAHVDAGALGPTASGEIHVRQATISRIGADGASPRIEDAHAHFIGLPHDLAGPFAIERTNLDVPAKFPDLRWLLQTPENGKPHPTDVSGAAISRARVSIDREGLAAGTVEAQSDHIALRTKAFALSARLQANVGFCDGNLATKSVVFSPSSLVAGDFAVARDGRNHPGGEVRVDVSEGRVEEGSPYYFALTVAAKLRDFGWLSIRDDKNSKRGAKVSAGNVRGSFIVLRPAALFDKSGVNPGITGQVSAGLTADSQFDDVALHGRVTASALVEGIDPGNGAFHFSNIQVAASNVEIDRGSAHTQGWWGRFNVRRFDAFTANPARITSHLEARCKDGAPFLAALESAGTIPSWVGGIFPMNDLTASGDLKSHDAVDINLDVKSSSADVSARLNHVGEKMDGAVLVSTAILSVGVGLTAGQSHVKFFAGEEWLRGRMAAMKADDRRRATLALPQ